MAKYVLDIRTPEEPRPPFVVDYSGYNLTDDYAKGLVSDLYDEVIAYLKKLQGKYVVGALPQEKDQDRPDVIAPGSGDTTPVR